MRSLWYRKTRKRATGGQEKIFGVPTAMWIRSDADRQRNPAASDSADLSSWLKRGAFRSELQTFVLL